MRKKVKTIMLVLIGCLSAIAVFSADVENKCSVDFEKDGTAVLSNSMFSVSVSPYVGQNYGISKWFNKPTGFEMIDVLYGQTDYVKGHILGERWEHAKKDGKPTGTPLTHNFLTVPLLVQMNDETRANELVQVGAGNYKWKKTIIIRQDYSMIEINYELENLKSDPVSTALRFHSAMSPGARGAYQDKSEIIFIDTKDGVLALDQSLNADKYYERYKQDKYFIPQWEKKGAKRNWIHKKLTTPSLTGNWIAQVNQKNGDGMTMIVEKEKLVGFYNCPGVTIEPVMKAIFLKKGEKWQARIFLGSFSGAKGEKIVDSNPLFVSCGKLTIKSGKLTGRIIPLFKGQLQVSDDSGKVIFEASADSRKTVDISCEISSSENWTVKALDTKNRFIGSIDRNEKLNLYSPKIEIVDVEKPAMSWFFGLFGTEVYTQDGDENKIKDFLDKRDFTVYCAWNDSKEVKALAVKIAAELGVGIAYTKPKGKLLMIGSVGDALIRDTGMVKQSISAEWPGKDKGAILYYDNVEFIQNPAILIGGSNSKGALKAEELFISKFLNSIQAPTGFAFWPASNSDQIYPYSRPAENVGDKIVIEMAKGEYECAQAVITSYEDLSDVKISVAPLISEKTGRVLKKSYRASVRRRIGPIQIRWVNYYPIDRKDGWAGYPDPLLTRPDSFINSDKSQSLWLTFITPEKMDAGVYTSSITCKSKQGTKIIPIKIKVWDFVIPKNGLLQGEAYTTLANLPAPHRRELSTHHLRRWVRNLVEHGMRMIHIGVPGMMRYHFDKEGKLKDIGDWFIASEDGKIALDASYLKWLINEADKAGRPYDLSYMLYMDHLTGRQMFLFKRAFPKRFDKLPVRKSHFYANYYSQEMLTLAKRFFVKNKLMKRIMVKVGDEPRSLDIWYNRFVIGTAKAGLPYYTCLNSIDWKTAEDKITDLVLWQPLYMYYNKEFFEKAKKAGVKVSWYNCGPPPRIAIMTPASELRGYIWQGAKADLDIIAWWGIQTWGSEGSGTGKDLWQNRYAHWNMATYPVHPYKKAYTKKGRGWVDTAPIDSVRWELIREGMEDAWYVNILRKEIAKVREKGHKKAAEKAQAVLDKIWKEVFPTMNDYRPEYAKILQARKAIAEEIVKLQKIKK